MPPTSSRARFEPAAPAAVAARSRGPAPRRSRASVLGPMPGTLAQPAGGGRLAQLSRGADLERPGELDRRASRSARGSGRGRPGQARARARARPARRSALSRSARAAAPRSPGRCRAARAPVRRHELGDRRRRRADRLGGPAVGAGRVRVRFAELQQRGERVEPVGDLRFSIGGSFPFEDGPR